MELTEAERATLYEAIRDSMPIYDTDQIYAAVEAIIASRLEKVEAERAAWRQAVDAALPPEPSADQFNRERLP